MSQQSHATKLMRSMNWIGIMLEFQTQNNRYSKEEFFGEKNQISNINKQSDTKLIDVYLPILKKDLSHT